MPASGLPPAFKNGALTTDIDAAVLHRLDGARDFDQLAGSGFRIGIRADG
jgi:hypothetical protein